MPQDWTSGYEGMVETTDRTEKELEPLRLMAFRMATVRERIAVIEREKHHMGTGEERDAIRQVIVMADEVVHETLALAEVLGQVDEFRRSIVDKYSKAPQNYREQILALFDAVDVFLVVNGFVRTVAPPGEDVAELLWQKCLEEHLTKYGNAPHPLLLTELGIFRDTMESILFQAALSWAASMESKAIADRVSSGIAAKRAEAAEKGEPFLWGRGRTSKLVTDPTLPARVLELRGRAPPWKASWAQVAKALDLRIGTARRY